MLNRNLVRERCIFQLFLFSWLLKASDAALLTATFPPETLSPPRSSDTYCFVLSGQGKPLQQQCFVSANYTFPVFLNLPPDTWFNVSVIANDLPLLDLTRPFLSGPDSVGNLEANVEAPNATVVSWSPPAASPVNRYRIQLLTRDPVSGNVTRGVPMDWNSTMIRITPLISGGEYAIEVTALNGALQSEPARVAFMQYPAPPKGFRRIRSLTTEISISLVWDPPEGFVDAFYLTANASVQPNSTFLPASIFRTDFQNLEPGKVFAFSLSTVRGNMTSKPSIVIAATRPPAPKDLKSSSFQSEQSILKLTWTPSGSEITNYRATVNSSQTGFLSTNTTESEVLFKALPIGISYNISVEAFIPDGDGILFSKPLKNIFRSDTSQIITVIAVEGAPELVLQTTDNTVKFLEANATSEDSLVVSGNVVNAQHVLFKDLVGGTRYLIYSKMLHNDVEEIMSFEKLTYPFPPTNLSTEASLVTTESVVLDWSRPMNTRFQGYEILYNKLEDAVTPSSNGSSIITPNAGASSYNLTGLVPGSKYSFRMRTLIEDVRSMETLPVLQCTRPLKPVAVSVRATSVKFILQLVRPSNTTKYYHVRLVNLDQKEQAPRDVPIRNDSALVTVSIPIEYLGAIYEVRVASYVCDLLSDVVAVTVNSLPPVVNFNRPPAEVTQTSIKLVYQITWPIMRSVFNRYAFQINDYPPKYVLPGESKTQTVDFTDLIPGTKYTVFGWTERGEVQSDRKSIEVQLKPDNVTSLNATKISSHSIAFEWQKPNGEVTNYEIGYNNSEPVYTNSTSWVFTGLLPYTVYSIYVAALSGRERSSALTKFYTTEEDKPEQVRLFTLSTLRPYKHLGIRWAPPKTPNGVITGYLLDYKESNSDFPWTQLSFPSNILNHVLTLTPGKSYSLRIAAVNKAGIGPAQDGSVTMPIGAPVLARSSARLVKLSSSTNSIVVEFGDDFFTNVNGDITNYTIIVAEDPTENTNISGHPLRWKDVQSFSKWPPYQALDYFNPFNGENLTISSVSVVGNAVARVVIGDEKDCDKSAADYCNGPLRENTPYFIKLRAFSSQTQDNLFTDTIYTEPVSTTAAPDGSALAIALGIIIPTLLILLLAFIFVIMRRKNWGPFVKRARKAVIKTSDDKISIAESLPEKSRPIKLKDFVEHMRLMTADSDFKFSEEYEDLKHVGRDQSCLAADFPVNRAKNRFTNILPYDHSRVKLTPTDDEEGSDYVNANYIPGQNSPREFIVMQGPLPSTRDDFWRMVWEQNCRAIVMLTRCVEKGREKCDHYWPYDTDPVVYGNVEVIVMNETQTVDWTIREFRVQMNDEPARSVRHFHYTAWPDFGVPERPQTLIKFVRAFRERISTDFKPIVVHCSAGVGRSGTFVALDRLLQQIKTQDWVDIFGMVVEMRKERVWMVQTEQQYICIHQCLLCVLENREDDPGPSSSIHENAGYEISDDEGIVESGPF